MDVPITNVDNLLTKISTYEIPLNGVFQRANATLAVGVVETLFNNHCGYLGDNFLSKKEEIIRQGLAEAKWPGRMEVCRKSRMFGRWAAKSQELKLYSTH